MNLSDTPANFTDSAHKILKVNSSNDGLEYTPYTFPSANGSDKQVLQTDSNGALSFVSLPFTDLSDTPSNFTSAAGKFLQVTTSFKLLE